MKQITYFCDVCGGKVSEDHRGMRSRISLHSIPLGRDRFEHSNYDNNSDHRLKEFDLCKTCQKEIYEFICEIKKEKNTVDEEHYEYKISSYQRNRKRV